MFSTFLFALVGLSARLTDLLTGFKLYLIMWNEAGNPKYLTSVTRYSILQMELNLIQRKRVFLLYIFSFLEILICDNKTKMY